MELKKNKMYFGIEDGKVLKLRFIRTETKKYNSGLYSIMNVTDYIFEDVFGEEKTMNIVFDTEQEAKYETRFIELERKLSKLRNSLNDVDYE